MIIAELSPRESTILREIVQEYINSARPVGSRTISRRGRLNLSPATIRNTMIDLEEMDYLTQPHTSAGRVPTDRAYRAYVDHLMDTPHISKSEKHRIKKYIRNLNHMNDAEEFLHSISKIIGEVSELLGVVLSPRFKEGIFEKVELIHLTQNKILMVLAIKSGLVKTIMLGIDTHLSRKALEKTASLLNERLSSLSIAEIKNTISERLKQANEGDATLLKVFIDQSHKIFDFSSDIDIHLGGVDHVLSLPEFSDREKALFFLELLEEKEIIGDFFSSILNSEGVSVTIGSEHALRKLHTLSFVTTTYTYGNVNGVIGILGPTRMRYPWLISLINYTGQITSEVLSRR